jgi:hypothetical protein
VFRKTGCATTKYQNDFAIQSAAYETAAFEKVEVGMKIPFGFAAAQAGHLFLQIALGQAQRGI